MSDDLVKRLRKFDWVLHELEIVDQAAERIEELEAKLAKAVEALHFIGTRSITMESKAADLRSYARMFIAELKGQDDD